MNPAPAEKTGRRLRNLASDYSNSIGRAPDPRLLGGRGERPLPFNWRANPSNGPSPAQRRQQP
jgi:hypothetical protein